MEETDADIRAPLSETKIQNEEAKEIGENANEHVIEKTCLLGVGSDDIHSEVITASDHLADEHVTEEETSTKGNAHISITNQSLFQNEQNEKVEIESSKNELLEGSLIVDVGSNKDGKLEDDKNSTIEVESQESRELSKSFSEDCEIQSTDKSEYSGTESKDVPLKKVDKPLSSSTIVPENVCCSSNITKETDTEPNSKVNLASKESPTEEYKDDKRSTIAYEVHTKVEDHITVKDNETLLPQSETLQMNPEEHLYVARDENDVSASCQATTAEKQRSNVNFPEVAMEVRTDETIDADYAEEKQTFDGKNITPPDLNEGEDVNILCSTAQDLKSALPLVEDNKQKQTFEENQVPIKEPQDERDEHEATNIPECSHFGQTLDEGALDVNVTSTSQIDADKIARTCKPNSTERLQTNFEKDTEDNLQQHGEASEEQDQETPKPIENTIHASETTFDASLVTSSEEACLHKEASSTPELRLESLSEMQDESKANEKEYVAEETSEVQPQKSVHEIQFFSSQSVENEKSVETGEGMDDHSLSLKSSKMDVDDLAISHSKDREILPVKVDKEDIEAFHVELEKSEKTLESVAQVPNSEMPYGVEQSGTEQESLEATTTEAVVGKISNEITKEESLEAATTETGFEKILYERTYEAKESTENYISSEKIRKEDSHFDPTEKEIPQEEVPSIMTHIISETTKSGDKSEVPRDDEVEDSKNIHKQGTDEDRVVKVVHEDSTEDNVLNKSLGEKEKIEYTHEEHKELNPQEHSDKLDRRCSKTEVKSSTEEVFSSEVAFLQHDKDQGVEDKEYSVEKKSEAQIVTSNHSFVADIAGSKGLMEDTVSEAEHEGLLFESTKDLEINEKSSTANEKNKEIVTAADNIRSESLMVTVKPDIRHVETASEENEDSRSSSLEKREDKEDETGALSLHGPLKENSNIKKEENEQQHSIIGTQSTYDDIRANDEGSNEKEKNEDQTTVATRGVETKQESDSQSSITEAEDKKINHRDFQLESLSPFEEMSTEVCHIDQSLDLAKPTDIDPDIVEPNKVSLVIKEKDNPEEPQQSESTEVKVPSAAVDPQLLHNDPTVTTVRDEIQKVEIENDPDAVEETIKVEPERKGEIDEPQEMEQESTSIKQGKNSESDLMQRSANETISVAERRNELGENHISECVEDANMRIEQKENQVNLSGNNFGAEINDNSSFSVSENKIPVPKDHEKSSEPVISSGVEDTPQLQQVSVSVEHEIEESGQANASEDVAETKRVYYEDVTRSEICGEEKGNIHDENQIPENSQEEATVENFQTREEIPKSVESSHEEAKSEEERISAEIKEAIETSLPTKVANTPALKEDIPQQQPVSVKKENEIEELEQANASVDVAETKRVDYGDGTKSEKYGEEKGTIHDDNPILESSQEEAAIEDFQTRREMSRSTESSHEEAKKKEEMVSVEIKEAIESSLPTEIANTPASQDTNQQTAEHLSERGIHTVNNEELQTENAEKAEDNGVTTNGAKDEEKEEEVQREGNPDFEVPLIIGKDPEDLTSNKCRVAEMKEDSSIAIPDKKIPVQGDSDGSIKTTISSEEKDQPPPVVGHLELEIDRLRQTDDFEATESNKDEEAKENYKDQAAVATRGSETGQDEAEGHSNVAEEVDQKIHDPDVKLENSSRPEKSSTNICLIDEPLDISKPTETAADIMAKNEVSLSTKEMRIPDELELNKTTEATITSGGRDVQLVQKDPAVTTFQAEIQKPTAEDDLNIAPSWAEPSSENRKSEEEQRSIDEIEEATRDSLPTERPNASEFGRETLQKAEDLSAKDKLIVEEEELRTENAERVEVKEVITNEVTDEENEQEVQRGENSRSEDPLKPQKKISVQGDLEESIHTVTSGEDKDIQPVLVTRAIELEIDELKRASTFEAPGSNNKKEAKEKNEDQAQDATRGSEIGRDEVPLMVEKDIADNKSNKTITATEIEEESSSVILDKKVAEEEDPEESIETVISSEDKDIQPISATRTMKLDIGDLKDVHVSKAPESNKDEESKEKNEDQVTVAIVATVGTETRQDEASGQSIAQGEDENIHSADTKLERPSTYEKSSTDICHIAKSLDLSESIEVASNIIVQNEVFLSTKELRVPEESQSSKGTVVEVTSADGDVELLQQDAARTEVQDEIPKPKTENDLNTAPSYTEPSSEKAKGKEEQRFTDEIEEATRMHQQTEIANAKTLDEETIQRAKISSEESKLIVMEEELQNEIAEKAEDKEVKTNEAKHEERERELQREENPGSKVPPTVEKGTVDGTKDEIISPTEINEDISTVIPDKKISVPVYIEEGIETVISSKNKDIQPVPDIGSVKLDIDELKQVDAPEAAGSNKDEEAKDETEDQATVATKASEIELDEADSHSCITEGGDPKLHDPDVKLENLSPPEESSRDICYTDEHLDQDRPAEIAPDIIEVNKVSLALKEMAIPEQPPSSESTELTITSADTDVQLLQKDPALTAVQDEIQKVKTENDSNVVSEAAAVESEVKGAAEDLKEKEQESTSIEPSVVSSESDLTQGSRNHTLSVDDERETANQLAEDHIYSHEKSSNIGIAQKEEQVGVSRNNKETSEPMISSGDEDVPRLQPDSTTVEHETEEKHLNASEVGAEAEKEGECGEEKGTTDDNNRIPESSKSMESTKRAPTDFLQGRAEDRDLYSLDQHEDYSNVIHHVQDSPIGIVQEGGGLDIGVTHKTEELEATPQLSSHEDRELEADPGLIVDLKGSTSDNNVSQIQEEAAAEKFQAGGEIPRNAEPSHHEAKSEEEQMITDEIKQVTGESLPTEEESPKIAERVEEKELKTDEAKGEEEEGDERKGEKSGSQVPTTVEKDQIDLFSAETKDESSSVVSDKTIPLQEDPEDTTKSVISSEQRDIQPLSVTGTVELDKEALKHVNASETAAESNSDEPEEISESSTLVVPAKSSPSNLGQASAKETTANAEDIESPEPETESLHVPTKDFVDDIDGNQDKPEDHVTLEAAQKVSPGPAKSKEDQRPSDERGEGISKSLPTEALEIAEQQSKEVSKLVSEKDDVHAENAETAEDEAVKKTDEEEERKSENHGSEAPVIVEASRDVDAKTPKKSHNILSGVGSKVKHSIAKVKKAITGKHSHTKPPSPK